MTITIDTRIRAMSKHTPGPWPTPDYDNDTGPDDGYFVEWWDIEGVCKVDKKEDAMLIAAAPCLLAALQACDEAMEYMSEYDIPITLPEKVKAAIRKATGESGE
jgi:asparagine synthetase A